jgi:hypothetical protein
MRNFLRTIGFSILNAIIITILLVIIVQLNLPISGIYSVFGVSAIIFPLLIFLLYIKLWGTETMMIVPVSFVLSALYSLGVSIYSYYGTGGFSQMFKDLMYFIYFLPSMIYCVAGWILFAIISRVSRNPRKREF